MVTRLLIGAVSAFLVFWAVLWWVQGREGLSVTTEDDLADERVSTRELGETAVLLSRYGLSAFVGSLGILIGCIAVLGPGRAEWAQRGTWAMICLALAAVAAMGVAWTWRGFRAERLPAQEDPGYVDRAISEGPSEALAGLFWGLVPVRLTLFVGTVGFGALAVFLVYWAVMLIAGEASLEAPKSAGTVGSVVEIFELVALVLFLALLLIGTVAGLVTGDADLIGACLVVLALYAVPSLPTSRETPMTQQLEGKDGVHDVVDGEQRGRRPRSEASPRRAQWYAGHDVEIGGGSPVLGP